MTLNFPKRLVINGNEWNRNPLTFDVCTINGGKPSPSWQDIILSGNTALTLTNALANGLNYLKLFGGTEQRNLPKEFTQVNYVTNTAQTMLDTGIKFDFSKNYEIELRVRGITGSWYVFQAKNVSGSEVWGISGSTSGETIRLAFGSTASVTSQITRVDGHIYYLKGIINNGNLTLYVKDETAGTEDTATGTYTVTTGQSPNMCLFGNLTGQYVGINSNVYFARIKENGNYIMDYVPCKQGTTAGFYDKASGTFKTTTNLSAGADAVPSPDTPMDIVSNNGAVKVSKNLFDYRYFYDNYMVPSTSTVGRVAIKLLPNTTYTVSTNTQQSSSAAQVWADTGSNPSGFSPVTNTNGVLIDSPRTVQSDSNGYIILAIRVGTEYEIKESDFESGNVWVQIELGSTATPYAPYSPAGIYTDGTVETVQVTGKNLFDKNDVAYNNSTILADGSIISAENISVLDYIPVQPNTTYTYSSTTNSARAYNKRMVCFDANKNYITSIADTTGNPSGSFSITGTTPANTKYVRVACSNDQMATAQIEQGSTATAYEPYTVLGTATAEMLLKVGTYQDVQSVLDGGVTRNIGIKVLDGTEAWQKSGLGTAQDPIRFAVSELIIFPDSNTIECLSTHYPFSGVASTGGSITPATFNVGIYNNIHYIRFAPTNITVVTDWTNYLKAQYNAGTPVIVVYPLATATTETVTAQSLSIQAGTNIVEITQSAIDNLGLEVSYKATV